MTSYLDDLIDVKRSSKRKRFSKSILKEELKRLRELREQERLAIERARKRFES